MAFWTSGGLFVVDATGKPIDCATCPCVPRVECLCNGTDGMPDGPLNATVTFCGTTTVISMPQGARTGIGTLAPPVPPYDSGYTVNTNCVWSCIGSTAFGTGSFNLLQLCGTQGVVESANLNWIWLGCFSYYNPFPTVAYQWRLVWSGTGFTNNAATGFVDNESAFGDDNIVLGIFPGSFVIDTTLPFHATLTVDLDTLVGLDATLEGFLDACGGCTDHTLTIVFTEP